MSTTTGAIRAVVEHVESIGRAPGSRQAVMDWAGQEPVLSDFDDAGVLAATIRTADPATQDRLLLAVLRVAADDALAQLVAIAGLAHRLRSVVIRWRTRQVPAAEQRTLEADLVDDCYVAVIRTAAAIAAGGPPPPRLGLVLVDRAHEAVRGPRRRLARSAARLAPLSAAAGLPAPGEDPPSVLLARHLTDAVRAGHVTAAAAGLVLATRVIGWTVEEVAERQGTSPESVRARRSRAERRLIAAA